MDSIEKVMNDINKKFKAKVLDVGLSYQPVNCVPFSSPRLNYMLYGGLPLGRIVEFFGEEGGGKTTTALDAVGNAQKLFPEKRVLYVDCEHTLDPVWAAKLGVDVTNLLVMQPEAEVAEKIFDAMLDLFETGMISIGVLDSIGSLMSLQAYEKTMEEKTYGGIASSLTLFSKKLIPILKKHNSTLIGINQLRENMEDSYGGAKTPGGRAWRHHCSVRIQFKKGDYVDVGGSSLSRSCESPAGNLVNCHVLKTKVCRPDRKVGFYTLNYLDGIDYAADIIDVAIKVGLINKSGAWYSFADTDQGEVWVDDSNKPLKFQGRASVKDYLLTHEDDLEYFKSAVLKKMV